MTLAVNLKPSNIVVPSDGREKIILEIHNYSIVAQRVPELVFNYHDGLALYSSRASSEVIGEYAPLNYFNDSDTLSPNEKLQIELYVEQQFSPSLENSKFSVSIRNSDASDYCTLSTD